MVRGCQKKIIVMKNIGSSFFDEAHFILKDSAAERAILEEEDMIAEANRIINENQVSPSEEMPHPRKSGAGWFAAGALSGGAVMAMLLILL